VDWLKIAMATGGRAIVPDAPRRINTHRSLFDPKPDTVVQKPF